MKKLITKSLLAVLLITMTALSFAGCKKKDNAETIRIGVLTGHSLPVIATVNGYFKDEGLPNIELVTFSAGAPEVEAFTSGALDIVNTGDLPAYNGINNGVDFRFIGTYSSTVTGNALVVRNASNIKSFSDLKGKKLAVPFGSNIHSLLYEYLEAGNVNPDDVEIINLFCADAVNALLHGDIDGAVIWNPYVNIASKDENLTVLADTSDFRIFVCPISTSQKYLDEHTENIKKVLKALDKAAKWITANKEEAAKKVAEYYEMNDYSSLLIGLESSDVDVKLTQDKIDALKLGAEVNYKYGILSKPIDVDKYTRPDLTAIFD